MRAPPSPARPTAFFLLVLASAIPFWVLGALTDIELLPGLPIAALWFVCPAAVAGVLTYREKGPTGLSVLLRRAVDTWKISPVWYGPILLIAPGAAVLCWVFLRLGGKPVPVPDISVAKALALAGVFLIAAAGEELGWSGYVLDPLQARWGALRASLTLGALWAALHYVALLQAHRSLAWIAWWTVGTVAMRVIMVWLYNHTGRSVASATLFHMTVDLAWQLFPVSGSYFDPRIHGLVMAAVATILLMIWLPPPPTSRPAR